MTTAKRSTPPAPGSRPSVRVDKQLSDDLAIIMRTGANLSDAIRWAVGQAAAALYDAWSTGACPVDTLPEITPEADQ